MLPGKKYTPEDILQILRRRIWVILVPLAVVSAATALWVRQLPNRFRSETVILVVPQRIPESYVKPTVTARIEDRLQSIGQQILSRTRLERIIQDFDLYAAQRQTSTMENVVERMRADINVQVVKSDAFRVAYIGDDAPTVMKVTGRLASLFIEENLRDREVLAESTNQFLEEQLDDARRRLIEQEKKLEEYRKRFSGELPSQLGSNLQVSQNIQMQLQALVESINRDRDRRLMIERQIAEAERESETARLIAGTAAAPAAVASPSPLSGTAYQELVAAQAEVSALERRLKPEHPDLRAMYSLVRDLEAKAAAEAGIVSAAGDPAPSQSHPRSSRVGSASQRCAQNWGNSIVSLQRKKPRTNAFNPRPAAISSGSRWCRPANRSWRNSHATIQRCKLCTQRFLPNSKSRRLLPTSNAAKSVSSSNCSIRRAWRSNRTVRTAAERPCWGWLSGLRWVWALSHCWSTTTALSRPTPSS